MGGTGRKASTKKTVPPAIPSFDGFGRFRWKIFDQRPDKEGSYIADNLPVSVENNDVMIDL
jgi:hypothetical protein